MMASKVSLQEVSKAIGISLPTLRRWIYENENLLRSNRVAIVLKGNKKRTIKVLDKDRLIEMFFEKE